MARTSNIAAVTLMTSKPPNTEESSNPSHEGKTTLVSFKTLRERRRLMVTIYTVLTEIRNAEESFINNMPENLQNSSRYDYAVERLEKLDVVIDLIGDIYAQ